MPPSKASKKKPLEHLKQHIRKNKIGAFVLIGLLLGAVYVLSSESRSPEQMRAMEGIEGTVAKFAEVSNSLRSVMRKQWGFSTSENRSKAAGLWETMNSYQREQEVMEVLEKLRAGPFAKAAQDLGTTDMVRMFQAACPDVISKEFSESHAKLWGLLDSWFKSSSQEGLSGESRKNLDEVIKLGFWNGVADLKFSEADVQKFSAIGWGGIRDVVLGIFFKGLGADLVTKQERIAAGETGVLPEAPLPWSAEPEAQVVTHLTDASFATDIAAKKFTFVMFYAPWCGHCKNFKPHMIQAATALRSKETVAIAAIDCTVEKQSCSPAQYNISAYPTLALFVDGQRSEAEFDGDRNAYGIVKWLNKHVQTLGEIEAALKPEEEIPWSATPGDVVHMTDDSFESDLQQSRHAMVMFYAPWCKHCQAFKPAYSDVATLLKGKALIGAMDATEFKVVPQKFEVKGYPTVLYFRNGKMVETYQGPRDQASVVSWMQAHFEKTEI